MPQAIPGVLLGNSVGVFRGQGAPTSATDPQIQNAAVGSLYLRTDGTSGSTLYVLIGGGVGWTAIA